MTEDTNQTTADNLRADFLNATTNWQRWKVLNQALDWALAASENAEHFRRSAEDLKARAEGKNVTVTLRAEDVSPAVHRAVEQQLAKGGFVHGEAKRRVPKPEDGEMFADPDGDPMSASEYAARMDMKTR
jgi:hypothetical protein